jgi:hypothetical protein
VDAVDRQLAAYNARDVDAFVSCYAEDAVVEDAGGSVLMAGRDDLRREYEPFFRNHPALRARILTRIAIGDYVVDEEEITGWQALPVRAVAIYHVAGDVIDQVRLYG